jgi:hypothetical protein
MNRLPLELTKKHLEDRKLIDSLLRAGISVRIVKTQPTRWDR